MKTGIVLAVALLLALPIAARANQAPHACFQVTAQNCFLTVCFDASCSTDDNGIILYAWQFGDGTGDNGVSVCHTYPAVGDYTVKLTVFDGNPLTGGKTDSTQQVVHASDCH